MTDTKELQPEPQPAMGSGTTMPVNLTSSSRPQFGATITFFLLLALMALVVGLSGCRSAKNVPGDSAETPGGPGRQPDTASALRLQTSRTPDLAHVDPAAFATALGGDPTRIFEFVRDTIAFEAYTGVLRGPRGTLLALAGNSADRAGLLAAMLRAAGQRVRFARGALGDREARALVNAMWTPNVTNIVASAGNPPTALGATLEGMESGIKRDFALIRNQLERAGIATRLPGPGLEALVAETQPHFWIQWHQDGKWTDLDPSFQDAAPGRIYARAEESFDALPERLAHRVMLRMRLEESRGGASATRVILQHETTAAALSGQDVVIGHMPERWAGPKGFEGTVSVALEDNGRLKPVLLLGDEVVFGQAFQHTEKTTGLGGIAGLLGGRGEALATAEWLDVEFIAPNGATSKTSREIFDRAGPARRAAGRPLTDAEIGGLAGSSDAPDVAGAVFSLLFATGRVHGRHLLDLAPERLATDPRRPDVLANARQLTIAFAALSDALCSTLRGSDGTVFRFYPDAPRLLIAEISSIGDKPRLVLDLRHDRQRAVGTGPRGGNVFLVQVFRGVVSGHLERALTDTVTRTARSRVEAVTAMSTSRLFEQVVTEKVAVLLLPRDTQQLDTDKVPDGRARLDETVASGHLAVVPKRPIVIDGRPRLAWWRIDPRSGETVAVTDEGLHQASFEITVERKEGTANVQSFEITVERERGTTNVRVTVRQYLGPNAVTQVGPAPSTVTYNAGVQQGFAELWRDINILLEAGGNLSAQSIRNLPGWVLGF